jgi:hypothetical protein
MSATSVFSQKIRLTENKESLGLLRFECSQFDIFISAEIFLKSIEDKNTQIYYPDSIVRLVTNQIGKPDTLSMVLSKDNYYLKKYEQTILWLNVKKTTY